MIHFHLRMGAINKQKFEMIQKQSNLNTKDKSFFLRLHSLSRYIVVPPNGVDPYHIHQLSNSRPKGKKNICSKMLLGKDMLVIGRAHVQRQLFLTREPNTYICHN